MDPQGLLNLRNRRAAEGVARTLVAGLLGMGVFVVAILVLSVLSFLDGPDASARDAGASLAYATPCGVLEDYGGELQILDSTRTYFIDPAPRAGIPCGAWISTQRGWARVKHREGHHISLGNNTFAELPEDNADGRFAGDELVLYRGQVYGQASRGAHALKIATANGRATLDEGGTGLVVFNQESEETQLVVTAVHGSIENRFETSRKTRVKAGEASELSLKLDRVVASAPRAVSLASLKAKLSEVQLPEREQALAIAAAKGRADRKFASVSPDEVTVVEQERQEQEHHAKSARRKIASSTTEEVAADSAPKPASAEDASGENNYSRAVTDGESRALRADWEEKVVGGEPTGRRLLHGGSRPHKVKVEAAHGRSPGSAAGSAAGSVGGAKPSAAEIEETRERERLMHELARVRDES